ncbi:MAG: tyrosine-type recombinase/integrase [Enterocloster bolteae]
MACTVEQISGFSEKEEKSEATISKYAYELQMFLQFLGKREIGKELMIQYRTYLSSRYRPQTVNGKLSAVNAFLKFTGLYEYRVKFLKVQRRAYLDETRELTQKEYERLMETAGRRGKYQLYYLMMTICSTGIRVSELRYVTVEAVMRGKAEIFMKGKYRIVIFPKNLAAQLKALPGRTAYKAAACSVPGADVPWTRSNICHAMKKLCIKAGVQKNKVFPHNFRHLFAQKFL